MSNALSKEERVQFEDILGAFNDLDIFGQTVSKYGTSGQLMERTNDTIWRPMPYIVTSQRRTVGTPVASQSVTQLSVPSRLTEQDNVTLTLNSLELRDEIQEPRLRMAAAVELASKINTSIRNVASLQGSLVVPITGAAGNYGQIAQAENMMNEQGIPAGDRHLVLNTRDYNGLADNLAAVTRSFGNAKSDRAYERSFVGEVAGFMTYKQDAGRRIAACTATVTMDTTGAQVRYVPRATDATGSNVDNRYQEITVSTTTGVVVGSGFTVPGIEAVHHINKEATGQLKTFRVIALTSNTTMIVSPPMISGLGGTDPERQYKNIEVTASGATQTLNWLNDNAAGLNPFWHKDSIELLPGRYVVPTDQGPNVATGTTDNGIQLMMTKSFDPLTFVTTYTFDTLYGVVNTNPQMNGVIIFGQP